MRLVCSLYDQSVRSLWPKRDATQTHMHVMVSRLHNASVSSNTTFPHRQTKKKHCDAFIKWGIMMHSFINFRKEALAVAVVADGEETEIESNDDLNQELFILKPNSFSYDHLNKVSCKVSCRFQCG